LQRTSQERLAQAGPRRQPREDALPERQEPRIPQCQALLNGSCRTPAGQELPADYLDVLPGHRLLLQPHGFEGLAFVLVETYAGDLTVVNRENDRAPCGDLDPVATTLVNDVRNDHEVASL
jgi:hypothetical protein